MFDFFVRILPAYEEIQRQLRENGEALSAYVNSLDLERLESAKRIDYNGSYTNLGWTEITVFDKQGNVVTADPYLNAFLAELQEKQWARVPLAQGMNEVLVEIDTFHPGAIIWDYDPDISSSTPAGHIDIFKVEEAIGKLLPWSYRGWTSYSEAMDYTPPLNKEPIEFTIIDGVLWNVSEGRPAGPAPQ